MNTTNNTRERRQPDATPGDMGTQSQNRPTQPRQRPDTSDEPVEEHGVRNNAGMDQKTEIRKPTMKADKDKDDEEEENDGNDTPRTNPEINAPIYDPGSTEKKIPTM